MIGEKPQTNHNAKTTPTGRGLCFYPPKRACLSA